MQKWPQPARRRLAGLASGLHRKLLQGNGQCGKRKGAAMTGKGQHCVPWACVARQDAENATEQRQLCRMTSCQCRQGSGAYREFWKGQLDLWTITWKVYNDMPGKAKPSATVRLPAAVIRCCRGWAEPLGRRCGCRASFAGVSCHVRPVCVPEAVKQPDMSRSCCRPALLHALNNVGGLCRCAATSVLPSVPWLVVPSCCACCWLPWAVLEAAAASLPGGRVV